MLKTALVGGLALAGWMLAGAAGTAWADESGSVEEVAGTALRTLGPIADRPLEQAGAVLDRTAADMRGGRIDPVERVADTGRAVLGRPSAVLTGAAKEIAPAPRQTRPGISPPAAVGGQAAERNDRPVPAPRTAPSEAESAQVTATAPTTGVSRSAQREDAEAGDHRAERRAPVLPISAPEVPAGQDDGDGAYVHGGPGPLLDGPASGVPAPTPPPALGLVATRYSYRDGLRTPADPTVTPD
ncbi:hypothetical protein DPM19_31475 [Actinomadura craniellae]|uniref:Uncharacterized protein n=2 Tax=Actinomadura craniellae TaxID=2231787 RepID=A0A365GZA4_9ACTN|nr:hypothetical protein DPM19_31475 [Actinomadura craniellae]